MGKEIVQSLNTYAKAKCGYATVHDVTDMSLEDRMESFFLSETCKYLYLVCAVGDLNLIDSPPLGNCLAQINANFTELIYLAF